MKIEETVTDLGEWAADGALGWTATQTKVDAILAGIATLRERIEELGGYSDDV